MRKLIIALAFGALFLPNLGLTLGLGEIEVSTALNQELDAEIELLSATPEETETLIVQLASREEFLRAGLDRPYLLNSLKFSTIMRDGKPYIKITTDKPIREPYLNFLVEVDWPKGHLLREYTILLDPPVFMGADTAPAARPAATEQTESRPQPQARPQPQSSTGTSFRPAAAGAGAGAMAGTVEAAPNRYQQGPAVTAVDYDSSGKYRIRTGDTLWSLAQEMRPDASISIEQMMLAMLKTNPEAFINENVNGLKRGYILRMPDRQMIDSMSQTEAVAMVRQQNALWREYQQALASGRPASAMPGEAEGGDMDMPGARDSRLEIVSAGTGISAAGGKDPTEMTTSELRAELALANEALESQRVQNEALQDQVSTLESRIEEMQSLLTLEDAELARMQGQPGEAEMEEPLEEPPMEMAETEVIMEETGEVMVIEPVEEEMAVDEAAEAMPDEEEAVFVDEAMEEEAAEQPVEAPVMEEDFAVTPSMQPEFMQPESRGLLSSPIFLAGAGAGVLLLIVLIALIIKRRKSAESEPAAATAMSEDTDLESVADMVEDDEPEPVIGKEEPEELEKSGAEAESFAQDEEAESFESDSTVVLPGADDTVVTTPEPSEKEEEPRDDIIAEADVYLAYGIYQQAEELLQNAIKENPDNDGYRVKLAETYFAARNKDSFIELAKEMNDRRAGENTGAWQKIVAIGTELTPDHELFAGAEAEMVGDVDMDDLMPKSPEPMDIDLGSEEGGESPDLDFSLDDEAAPTGEAEQTAVLDSGDEDDSTAILDLTADELGLDTTEPEAGRAGGAEEEEGVSFDLDETGATEAPAGEPGSEEEFSLDIGADELDIQDEAEEATQLSDEEDVSFDIEDLGEKTGSAESPEEEALSIEGVDESNLDFDIGGEETAPEETAEEADAGVEMPTGEGMDFDLTEEAETQAPAGEEAAGAVELETTGEEEKQPEAAEPSTTEAAAPGESFEDEMELSDLDDLDEISTKLDLARAYLDMGDAEGTRSILDEVMAEGNDEQKKEARELLEQL